MGERPSRSSRDGRKHAEIDFEVAYPARVRNVLAGGDANFAADREAIEYVTTDMPGGMEAARATVRSLATFTNRAVRFLASEKDVRQYIVFDAPIPTANPNDVHVAAQRLAPDSRIVYVGDDPVVLAHSHSLRKSSPSGAAEYVHSTLGRLPDLLEQAAATLDFTRSIAVLLVITLTFVPDEKDPYGIMAELRAALAPGSFLVVAHTTDLYDGVVASGDRLSKTLQVPYVVRTRAEIERFLDGLELVDPGLVQIDQWHPDPDLAPLGDPLPVPVLAAVGRRP
jgi:S-adenosyl methyltransferase